MQTIAQDGSETVNDAKTNDHAQKWTAPGRLAVCRNLAGTDLVAGVLLYRMVGLWIYRKKKLCRMGKEWLAMSRDEWARSAGLTTSETKNRALPRLRTHCSTFLDIRTMKLKPSDKNNMIWISIDWALLHEEITPWDMYEPMLNGESSLTMAAKYPYKKEMLD